MEVKLLICVHVKEAVNWDHHFTSSVKCSCYRPGCGPRLGRGIALFFHDRSTIRAWVVSSTPRPYFTPGKDKVPILQEAGWAPGRYGRVEKLAPPGFDPPTVQPIVSRYTDWATRPTLYEWHITNFRSRQCTLLRLNTIFSPLQNELSDNTECWTRDTHTHTKPLTSGKSRLKLMVI